MDIDPLADTLPPRHEVESDEEDAYDPLQHTPPKPNQTVDVVIIGDVAKGSNLILATGDIAGFWAAGANLGEQSGAISVNGIQFGLIFKPKWSKSTIIVSEALTKLPTWAMHQYAQDILDTIKPQKISLLDIYSAATYITLKPVSLHTAPLRYLTTLGVEPSSAYQAEVFSPPNLIQSTSASFLCILSTKYRQSQGTLVLVPSLRVPHPSPKVITPSNFSHLSESQFEWSQDLVATAHQLVCEIIGEGMPPKWKHSADPISQSVVKQPAQLGEGGMYI